MRYTIEGGNLPVLVCTLDRGEVMLTEGGGMAWMSPDMQMETTSGGGLGKIFGRLFAGESLFLNRYTAGRDGGQIAFASSFPGSILPFDIQPGRGLVVQKSAFLASQSGVELSIFFQKRLGTAFFGGEGFIMQKLSGQGAAFVEIDGTAKEYTLEAGQKMVVSTGYLAAMDESCSMEIETVPGVKNMLFGGEGIFNTVVTGPGRVILQSHPISAVAGALMPFMPSSHSE